MIYIGIDPGKAGAIAFLEDGPIRAVPMPLIKHLRGQGRDEFDLRALSDLLDTGDGFATVERGQPLPPKLGGGVANYQRGYSRGIIEGLLVALRIPYQLVAPRRWQAVMHEGTPAADTKVRSIMAAERLFPDVSLLRSVGCRKPDDGMAEALLLAEFGRRAHRGPRAG